MLASLVRAGVQRVPGTQTCPVVVEVEFRESPEIEREILELQATQK